MRVLKHTKIISIALPFCLLTGCFKALPPSDKTHSAAHEKFLKICREEFNYPVVVKSFKRTLWIYSPTDEPILNLKAGSNPAQQPDASSQKAFVNFLETGFDNGTFTINYDVSHQKAYKKDLGYQNAYTESFTKRQSNLLTAVWRSFSEIEDTPPEFIVLVIADTTRGIIAKGSVAFQDLKGVMSMPQSITTDEYQKRYISEIFGQASIINDKAGTNIDYKELSWPEFLAKQIETRVNFKYQQSSFPPQEDAEAEILKIAEETVRAYGFEDFQSLKLNDLKNNKSFLFDKKQLSTFSQK